MAGNIVDFSLDDELNWEAVQAYRQRLEFLPFLQARLQLKQDSLPEFKVSFKIEITVRTKTEGLEEKEFIRLKINIDEDVKPGKNYSKVIALGNRLMGEIGLITLPRKFNVNILMDIETGRPKDKPFSMIRNIQLYQDSHLTKLHYYTTNQAIMDRIGKAVISVWEECDSTEFVMYITIHY